MNDQPRTLPELSREWGYSLDRLRKFIRRDESLRALGTTFGATRVYNADEAKQIKESFERSKA